MEVIENECFRVDLQDRLPAGEIKRRREIKERLESQFNLWMVKEQQEWSAISRPDTYSFLGLQRSAILPSFKEYIDGGKVEFGLLSELQLCTIRAAVIKAFQNASKLPETWLYNQYCHYAIRIQDLGAQIRQYNIPLIEATVALGQNPDGSTVFEGMNPDLVSRMFPEATSAFRLVLFPQTRYSFIEDEVFHGLYPLPEEHVKRMAHSLKKLQGNNGYHNALPNPFANIFPTKSCDAEELRDFRYLAVMYHVIDFEFVTDYKKRKRSERLIKSIQHRNRREGFPTICQWRYSRLFDFTEESQLRAELSQDDTCPERIQSARALFEYDCGDYDTLELDLKQTSLLGDEEHKLPNGMPLLVVDPLWLLVFPKSNTLCAFRNQKMDDPFKEIWGESINHDDWGQVLLQLVNKADKCMGSYEPIYRKRLSKLHYQIHTIREHNLVQSYNLVKYLSNFVAELTIILKPLQAQIDCLQQCLQYQRTDGPPILGSTENLFGVAIDKREVHLNSLKKLQEQARELRLLLFQHHSTETAYRQSQLATEMAEETKEQRKIAMRNESQNISLLIFTIITVIFLPLSFFTSYFGMNTSDIRTMDGGQLVFWSISGPVSLIVVAVTCFVAFHGRMKENFPRFHRRSNKIRPRMTEEGELD